MYALKLDQKEVDAITVEIKKFNPIIKKKSKYCNNAVVF